MGQTTRKAPPLDAAGIDRLALRYVERFATTRARLTNYLNRKVRERGWEGPTVELADIAQRLADLGYVDDRAFADAKARAMGRRGLGARRISGVLRQAGVESSDTDALAPDIADRSVEAALILARRRKIGPFSSKVADRLEMQRQIGMMIRAGHELALSRRIVRMEPGANTDELLND